MNSSACRQLVPAVRRLHTYAVAIPVRAPCDEAAIPSTTSDRISRSNGAWVLAAAILGSSMAYIDGTVANVAPPALQSAFQATLAEVQWVVESYALSLADAPPDRRLARRSLRAAKGLCDRCAGLRGCVSADGPNHSADDSFDTATGVSTTESTHLSQVAVSAHPKAVPSTLGLGSSRGGDVVVDAVVEGLDREWWGN